MNQDLALGFYHMQNVREGVKEGGRKGGREGGGREGGREGGRVGGGREGGREGEGQEKLYRSCRQAFHCSSLQISVTVNRAFIHYLHNYPLVLETFGHYQHHPLHKASTEFDGAQSGLAPSKVTVRSASPLPPSKFSTSPVRSSKTVVFDSTG